jgi:hypothetical protein
VKMENGWNMLRIETRDNSVGIATECGLDGQALIPGRGKIFSSTGSRLALGPTQPHPRVLGTLSQELIRLRRETDDSPSSNAEVNDGGASLSRTSSWCGA